MSIQISIGFKIGNSILLLMHNTQAHVSISIAENGTILDEYHYNKFWRGTPPPGRPSITLALDNKIYVCTLIKKIKHALILYTLSMFVIEICKITFRRPRFFVNGPEIGVGSRKNSY